MGFLFNVGFSILESLRGIYLNLVIDVVRVGRGKSIGLGVKF